MRLWKAFQMQECLGISGLSSRREFCEESGNVVKKAESPEAMASGSLFPFDSRGVSTGKGETHME